MPTPEYAVSVEWLSDRAVSSVDISLGDVQHSQLVIGDHNTIQTPDGAKVTVLQVGERPVPQLRPLPISRLPRTTEILGREEELALIAASSAEVPVQLYAPDGAGKTSVLKWASLRASPPPEGTVFESARHRSLDEIQASLFAAFWECETPFIPAPSEFEEFLGDREALVFLDDCALDRSELEVLLDRVPRCTVVLASQTRTLWSRGTARGLADLDPVAAVGLLGRELGRSLDPDEQEAAGAVVTRLGGNPQSLVETAALVEDGRCSLRQLADDPATLERRFDPSALTDPQKRILMVLSALDGAPLGVEHVSAMTGIGEVGDFLRELERQGWVKAASPRYRITRPLPPEAVGSSQAEIAKPLLGHLTAWSSKVEPAAVAEEAEAIESALELGSATERWEETLALTIAAQRGLMVAGTWSSCWRVLRSGLRAAAAVGDESARAYVLHQWGPQSLGPGDCAEAVDQLTEALQIREHIGEQKAAELTRHNLDQMGGDGDGEGDGGGGGGGGPSRPRMAIALTVLAVVGALALAGGDGRNAADTKHGGSITDPTTTPLPGAPPAITIDSPESGAVFKYKAKSTPVASFRCVAAEGAELEACEGAIGEEQILDGDPLDVSPGTHTLVLLALDDEGRETSKRVSYSVEAPQPRTVDDEPPEISIASPGGTYVLGQPVTAEYACSDAESEPVTCSGPVESGGAIDTKTLGAHEFTVTAVDSAGNEMAETASYEVIEPEEEEPAEVKPEEVG